MCASHISIIYFFFYNSKSRGIFGLFKSFIGIFLFGRSIASPFQFVRQQTGVTKRYKPQRRTQIFRNGTNRTSLFIFLLAIINYCFDSRAQNPLAQNRRCTFYNICIIPTNNNNKKAPILNGTFLMQYF